MVILSLGPGIYMYALLSISGALLDTGSPAIVSMRVAMKALAKSEQSPVDWEQDISSLLEEPILTLYSYGGGQFDTVRQLTAIV